VDIYDEVSTILIPGHNPDLVMLDEKDQEVERIDLTQYKTQEELHGLLTGRGFKAAPPGAPRHPKLKGNYCADEYKKQCPLWAASGECATNPWFMKEKCQKSCEWCDKPGCTDDDGRCPRWSNKGECVGNTAFMHRHCRKSCGECGPFAEPGLHESVSGDKSISGGSNRKDEL